METSTNTARPAGIPAIWKDRAGNPYPFQAAWHYHSPDGEPQGIVARFQSDHHGKQVIPFFKPGGNGKFKAGGPQAPVLFGAERLNGHKARVVVVEGEKAAAALHSLGLPAVSSQGGAGNAKGGAWDALLGAAGVVFWPDNDRPGMNYCQDAAAALAALATPDRPCPEMRLLHVLGLPEKGDVCDWLAERLPDWNQLDPVPADWQAALATELAALLDTAEPIPANWLKPPSAKPEKQERNGGPFGNRYL